MPINYSNINDAKALKDLYQLIAASSNTLGMLPEECTLEHFEQVIEKSNDYGIIIGADEDQKLIGFVYAYKLNLKLFDHMLSNMAIGVHPQYQRQGIAKNLLEKFFEAVDQEQSIIRVELIAAANPSAIKLYENFGFKKEGTLAKRATLHNKLVDNIAMAWLKD